MDRLASTAGRHEKEPTGDLWGAGMRTARATMHGAISIVNAIATGNGSSLGISLKVTAEASLENGQGVRFQTRKENKLISNIVYNTLPKDIIAKNLVSISIESEIPIGFGLKSSSAVSNAV